MKEAISKFTIFGIEYVKLEDLNELIRDMLRKTREGKEPGYMNQTKEQRIAVIGAMGHLRVILNKERNFDTILCRLMKTRFEREEREAAQEMADKEKAAIKEAEAEMEPLDFTERLLHDTGEADEAEEPKGSWMVYKPGKRRDDFWLFREWDDGDAILGKDGGMVFTYKGMAERVAEKLGAGWVVVDVSQEHFEKCEHLLAAILGDNEPEYHGDGTKAENEDWDGDAEAMTNDAISDQP